VDLVTRAKNIILRPGQEWPVVAAEPASPAGIVAGYVAPLAAISPIATFVGLCIVGIGIPFVGTYRTPIAAGIVQAVISFVFGIIGIFLVAAIVNVLAPSFNGQKNWLAALKVTAYSYTPAFVAGILLIFPPLGILCIIAAFYGIYLLYAGLPVLMNSPKDKAPLYTVAVVFCAIVVGLVFGAVSTGVRAASYAMTGGFGGFGGGDMSATQGADDASKVAAAMVGTAMGGGDKNQQAAQQMVDSVASAAADSDAAQKSGDTNAQAAAGLNMLKSIVTGGKSVTVVPRDQLAALLPDAVGDMTRGDPESDSGSFAGIKASKASALYKDSTGSVQLEVGDMGNAGGLAAIAGAAANLAEHEDNDGYEKNVDLGNMKVHETWTNATKHSELFAIVDNRWALGATGDGVDMDTAVKALQTIDVSKLQALEGTK
jgi:hypothetical protein